MSFRWIQIDGDWYLNWAPPPPIVVRERTLVTRMMRKLGWR